MRSLTLVTIALPTLLVAQAGVLDESFGTNGVTLLPIGPRHDTPFDLLVQPDDKIVLVGYASNGVNNDFMAARFNADGTVDDTFGTNGVALYPVLDSTDNAYAVVMQPDGKLILAGTARQGANTRAAAMRLNADGSLDTGFGNGGSIALPLALTSFDAQQLRDVFLLDDGKIMLAGWATRNGTFFDGDVYNLWRLQANGQPDFSFTGIGLAFVTRDLFNDELNDQAMAVDRLPDGRFLVAGGSEVGSDQRFSCVIWNADGTIALSGSEFAYDLTPNDDFVNSIVPLPDGDLIFAGHAGSNAGLLRWDPVSGPVSSFGTNGELIINPGYSNPAYDAILNPWDKVLVVGPATEVGNSRMALYRLNSEDGSYDLGFGTNGLTELYVPGSTLTTGRQIGLQSDGRIVVAGTWRPAGFDKIFIARFTNDISTNAAAPAPAPELGIGPVPCTDAFMVHGAAPGSTIEVLDALGRIVRTAMGTETTTVLDVSTLQPGRYQVRVTSGVTVRSLAQVVLAH